MVHFCHNNFCTLSHKLKLWLVIYNPHKIPDVDRTIHLLRIERQNLTGYSISVISNY